jgi:hypothetical protein
MRVAVINNNRLDMAFANGDILIVHDAPVYRSWWFIRYGPDGEREWTIADDGNP